MRYYQGKDDLVYGYEDSEVPKRNEDGSSMKDITVSWPPPVGKLIPYSITQRQMRLTLLGYGIYDQVEAAIEAMTGPEGKAAKITWTWAQEVKRDNPLLLSLATSFGLSEEDIDDLFIAAASIE